MPRKPPSHRKNTYVYRCTRCGEMPAYGDNFASRDLLVQKKVYFMTLGQYGQAIATRVVDWLCPDCFAKDEDFLKEPPHRQKVSEVEDLEEYLMLTDPTYAQEGGSDSAEYPH